VAPVPSREGESAWQQQVGPTAFAPFGEDTDYFGADRPLDDQLARCEPRGHGGAVARRGHRRAARSAE